MLKLNKTAVAVLVACSSAVSAGTMGPVCVPGAVNTPCEAPGWSFGVSALYLQPIYDADFGYSSVTAVAPGEVTFNNLDNRWDWGFKLEASRAFGPGNDINVNWYHIKSDNGNRFSDAFIDDDLFAGAGFGRDVRWDAVNLEMAQTFIGGHKVVRIHGGGQYANIKTREADVFPATFREGAFTDYRRSEFSGGGPRAGIDMNYKFGNGFGVYGKSAAAILLGNSKFYNFSDAAFPTSSYGTKRAMVPELDMRLGADWNAQVGAGNLTLDVGYMWFNYFNAQHNLGASFAGLNQGETDFAAQGPYFGFVYEVFA